MSINNPRYYNAAIAGISAAVFEDAGPTASTSAAYLAYQTNIAAAAAAVDAAIAPTTSSGVGGTLLQAICTGVFAKRAVSSSVQATYSALAAVISAIFTELLSDDIIQPGSSKQLAVVVPSITAPNDAEVAITDAFYDGALTIDAAFVGAPSNTKLGIQAAWVTTSATGVINISFVKVSGNYVGATEQVRVGFTS